MNYRHVGNVLAFGKQRESDAGVGSIISYAASLLIRQTFLILDEGSRERGQGPFRGVWPASGEDA